MKFKWIQGTDGCGWWYVCAWERAITAINRDCYRWYNPACYDDIVPDYLWDLWKRLRRRSGVRSV